MLAMVELYLEAVRRPGVRDALSGMVLANAEAAAALQQAAGLPSTVRDTGLLDAYFLGVAISLLALPVETLETVGLDDPYALGIGVFSATVPGQRRPGNTATSRITVITAVRKLAVNPPLGDLWTTRDHPARPVRPAAPRRSRPGLCSPVSITTASGVRYAVRSS